jgi:hypothetical protein
MERILSTFNFPLYVSKYYGGDVQTFWFMKKGNEYFIIQRPHYLRKRIAAKVFADNVKEAKRKIFYFARDDDKEYA